MQHLARNTGNAEWYTPPEYLDIARKVMSGIDVDPASSEIAQATVQAETYFTADDDGLAQDWVGRVWLNPPYRRWVIDRWIDKLQEQITAGNVTEWLVLVNNSADTRWAQQLLHMASAVCFLRGRIRFLTPDGVLGAPLQGQMLCYGGDNVYKFAAATRGKGFTTLGLPKGE